MLIIHIALGILLACAVLFVINVAIATIRYVLEEAFGPIDWTIGTVLLLLAILALSGCLAVFALVVLVVIFWTAPGFGVAILLVLLALACAAYYDCYKTKSAGTLRRMP
jgi:hypothetical protein